MRGKYRSNKMNGHCEHWLSTIYAMELNRKRKFPFSIGIVGVLVMQFAIEDSLLGVQY